MVDKVLLPSNGSLRRIRGRGSVEEHVRDRYLSQLVRWVPRGVADPLALNVCAVYALGAVPVPVPVPGTDLAVIASGSGVRKLAAKERHVTIFYGSDDGGYSGFIMLRAVRMHSHSTV
jgi:hypothetical protein